MTIQILVHETLVVHNQVIQILANLNVVEGWVASVLMIEEVAEKASALMIEKIAEKGTVGEEALELGVWPWR